MTARNTMTFTAVQPADTAKRRRQMTTFALVWMGITLIIGAITFAALFAATGLAARNNIGANTNRVQPPPPQNNTNLAAVIQITATPPPVVEIQPTTESVAPVQAAPSETPNLPLQPTNAPPTPTIQPILDTAFDLGIAIQKNPDPAVYALWVQMAGDQLKLNWVKSQVVWRDTELAKGQYEWGELDTAINLLSAANVKVLLSITKAPDWARDPGAKLQPGVFDGPPANPQDFADFLTALLNRYKGKVHGIEVWNEINIDREWSTNPPAIDARRYVTLLQSAYQTIKSIDPSIVVLSSGLAPTGANIPGAVTDDFVYMDQLIAAGMLQFADCVGAHHNGLNVPPTADYNNIPERVPPASYRGPWQNPHHSWSFKSTLEGYGQRIVNAGSSLKLCVTEFGWPTMEDLKGRGNPRDGFGFAFDNTLADQADFTRQAIDMMEASGIVRLAFLWNLNYGAQAGWQLGDATGDNVLWSILGPDYQARPVWNVIVEKNFRGRARLGQ
ncbi:MAG TPA: hypothetical protein PLD47_18105 [Aggregatilineales bacterium]|nr:hypothetical protein [Anaerolineales bacterium]HRE49643.1 hypothetical protein [Aggregatilineales bacterium]